MIVDVMTPTGIIWMSEECAAAYKAAKRAAKDRPLEYIFDMAKKDDALSVKLHRKMWHDMTSKDGSGNSK